MNKKRAKTFALAVALCSLLVSILGCGDSFNSPIGGAENRPITDFLGKTYKSQYNEEFSITKEGEAIVLTIGAGTDNTKATVIESKSATTGTVHLLECSHHKNYGQYQYPTYAEKNPHTGCFTLIHIRSINDKTVEWATFSSKLGATGEGQYGTPCFAPNSKAKAQEYLDFSKWDPPMYSTGRAQN